MWNGSGPFSADSFCSSCSEPPFPSPTATRTLPFAPWQSVPPNATPLRAEAIEAGLNVKGNAVGRPFFADLLTFAFRPATWVRDLYHNPTSTLQTPRACAHAYETSIQHSSTRQRLRYCGVASCVMAGVGQAVRLLDKQCSGFRTRSRCAKVITITSCACNHRAHGYSCRQT